MSERHLERVPIAGEVASLHSAYEVVAHIVQSNAEIESLTLVSYEEAPNWLDLHRADRGADVLSLLKGLQQDRGERILTRLSRKEVSPQSLREIAHSLCNNRLLGVVSRVRTVGGGSAHIPMMDFICTRSRRNLEILVRLLKGIRRGRGCLLDSGGSYHYYAFQLLVEEEWRIFLGKCLLMFGYADDRYIGHQLVDGHCVLRLSSGQLKPGVPRVVAELP